MLDLSVERWYFLAIHILVLGYSPPCFSGVWTSAVLGSVSLPRPLLSSCCSVCSWGPAPCWWKRPASPCSECAWCMICFPYPTSKRNRKSIWMWSSVWIHGTDWSMPKGRRVGGGWIKKVKGLPKGYVYAMDMDNRWWRPSPGRECVDKGRERGGRLQ